MCRKAGACFYRECITGGKCFPYLCVSGHWFSYTCVTNSRFVMPVDPQVLQELIKKYGVDKIRSVKDSIASRRQQKMFDRVSEKIANQRLPGEIKDEPLVPMEQEIMSYTDAGDPMQMYEAGQMIASGDILPGVGMMALTLAPNALAKPISNAVSRAARNKVAVRNLDLARRAEAGDADAIRQFASENGLYRFRDNATGETVFAMSRDGVLRDGDFYRIRNGQLVPDNGVQVAGSASPGVGGFYQSPNFWRSAENPSSPYTIADRSRYPHLLEEDLESIARTAEEQGLSRSQFENYLADSEAGSLAVAEEMAARNARTVERIAHSSDADSGVVRQSRATAPNVDSASEAFDWDAFEGLGNDLGLEPVSAEASATLNSMADAARSSSPEGIISRTAEDIEARMPQTPQVSELPVHSAEQLSTLRARRMGFYDSDGNAMELTPGTDFSGLSDSQLRALAWYDLDALNAGFRPGDPDYIDTNSITDAINSRRAARRAEHEQYYSDYLRGLDDQTFLNVGDFIPQAVRSGAPLSDPNIGVRYSDPNHFNARDYFRNLSRQEADRRFGTVPNSTVRLNPNIDISSLSQADASAVLSHIGNLRATYGADPLFRLGFKYEDFDPLRARLSRIAQTGVDPYADWSRLLASGDASGVIADAESVFGDEWPLRLTQFMETSGVSPSGRSALNAAARTKGSSASVGRAGERVLRDYFDDLSEFYEGKAGYLGSSKAYTPAVKETMDPLTESYLRGVGDQLNVTYPGLGIDFSEIGTPESLIPIQKAVRDNGLVPLSRPLPLDVEHMLYQASGDPALKKDAARKAMSFLQEQPSGTANFEFNTSTDSTPMRPRAAAANYGTSSGQVTVDFLRDGAGNYDYRHVNDMGESLLTFDADGTPVVSGPLRGMIRRYVDSGFTPEAYKFTPEELQALRLDPTGASAPEAFARWNKLAEITDNAVLGKMINAQQILEESMRASGVPGTENFVVPKAQRLYPYSNSFYSTTGIVPFTDRYHPSYFYPKMSILKHKYGGFLGGYSGGGSIHIKPENRGKFTALLKRTGKTASWYKAHGTPAQKKMAVFALNARKWKHGDGGLLRNYFEDGGPDGSGYPEWRNGEIRQGKPFNAIDRYLSDHPMLGHRLRKAKTLLLDAARVYPYTSFATDIYDSYVGPQDESDRLTTPLGVLGRGADIVLNTVGQFGETEPNMKKVFGRSFLGRIISAPDFIDDSMKFIRDFAEPVTSFEDGGFLQQYPDGGRIKGKRNGKFYVTELNDRREKKFQDWYANAAATLGLDPNPDAYEHAYDYRGYWLNNRDADVSSPGFHFPDTWKQPHHPTFSDESIYAKGHEGVGHWEGERFVPGPFNNIMRATEPSVTVSEEAPVTYGSNYTPSDNILQYIKDIEAFRDQWYQDGNGVWTVGYGFTGDDVRRRYPNGMTRAEADQYFADTVSRRIPMFVGATPNFDRLNQNQRDALFSYYYNIGHGGYTRKSPAMQEALKNFDLDTVVSNIDFGYNDKKNRGLRKRRDYERKLFGTPMDYGGILNRLRNVYGDNESVKAAILRAKNVKK